MRSYQRKIMGIVSQRKILLFSIFLIALGIALRIPGITQENSPILFCDERLFLDYAYQILLNNSYKIPHLLSGILNFQLPIITGELYKLIFGQIPSFNNFIVINRLFFPIVLSSIAPLLVMLAYKNLFNSWKYAIFCALGFLISPMLLGTSRIFYPDHYIVFFSSLSLFFVSKINADWKVWFLSINFPIYCLIIGIATSIKLNAIVLIGIPYIIILINNKPEIKNFFILLLFISINIIIIGSIFYFINDIYNNYNLFIEGYNFNYSHYMSGHIGLESNSPLLWYGAMAIFLPFGIFGSTLFLSSFISLFFNKNKTIISLIIFSLIYILLISRFKVVGNRNLMLILPFLIVIQTYGLSVIFKFLKNKNLKTVLILILLFQPFSSNFLSIINDFQEDSRFAARKWIERTLERDAVFGYDNNCFGSPVPEGFRSKFYPVGSSILEWDSPDYYVEDEYTVGSLLDSFNQFNIGVYHESWFLNPTRTPYKEFLEKHLSNLEGFKEIKKFSSIDYYGPTIRILKNNNLSPSKIRLSPNNIAHLIGSYDGATETLVGAPGEIGVLAFGPYTKLAIGKYEAQFKFTGNDSIFDINRQIGNVDVVCQLSTTHESILASKPFFSRNKNQIISLEFKAKNPFCRYEFRIFKTDVASRLSLKQINVESTN